MPRAPEVGIGIGVLPTGPTNSVLDVPGVGLGHTTLVRDEPRPPEGRGVARTGVTRAACSPRTPIAAPLPAGGAVLNGAGECTGFLTRRRVGLGRDTGLPDLDACSSAGSTTRPASSSSSSDPEVADDFIIPVVAECDDSFLNDCRRMQVEHEDVARGVRRGAGLARLVDAPPAEGAVGVGHRDVLPGLQGRHRHGVPRHAGRAHGRGAADDELRRARASSPSTACRSGGCSAPRRATARPKPAGSCIGVVVTDAPVDGAGVRPAGPPGRARPGPHRLGRPPRQRRDLHGRFGTGMRIDRDGKPEPDARVDRARARPAFAAVVEAAEEAVLNSMFSRADHGRPGRQHQRGPRPGRRRARELLHGRPRLIERRRRGPDPDGGRRRAGRDALPARRGGRAAAVPARGAALPQGRPHVVVRRRATSGCATSTAYAVCRLDLRGTGSSAGDATDEYPDAEQRDLPTVIAWLAEQDVVRRQRRHVRHVVLRLQLAADRLRAAAGAQGDLRDLRHRRPLDRRRALARRRAAAGRPRRLLPLHDADVRAAAGAGGVGRRLARRVAAPARDQRAVGADLAAGEPRTAPTGATARCGSAARRGLRADRRAR